MKRKKASAKAPAQTRCLTGSAFAEAFFFAEKFNKPDSWFYAFRLFFNTSHHSILPQLLKPNLAVNDAGFRIIIEETEKFHAVGEAVLTQTGYQPGGVSAASVFGQSRDADDHS